MIHRVMWRRIEKPGMELCRLDEQSFRIEGTVLLDYEEFRYDIECSPSWQTRSVNVEHDARLLELRVDEQQRWWRDGVHVAELDGCIDVDLSITPSTNTLPIRRLNLGISESADVVAAWIRFPELTIELLPQRYMRTGPREYRYESRGGSFTAMLEIDNAGIVRDYLPAWKRVASPA